ncbi:hypothetical protein Ade02nite_57560 [Paractinoplanes deccanensis]|uniref:Uncharacterized protein n=1 Tax=Paractinoplanes deccanensis TaxID=113561 RepID=A0ABQ3YBC5_9ACTN|nr:hypothetical protein Ade02nite_57560 [Actinoplanes deccanensis]
MGGVGELAQDGGRGEQAVVAGQLGGGLARLALERAGHVGAVPLTEVFDDRVLLAGVLLFAGPAPEPPHVCLDLTGAAAA